MTIQLPEYGRDRLARLASALAAVGLAALIAGCQSTPMPPHTPVPSTPSPAPATPLATAETSRRRSGPDTATP